METERYLSGYCRQLDASRIVEVILKDGKIEEVDCCFGSCSHQPSCLLASQLEELEEK